MTVKELIEELKKHPEDSEVELLTWDGPAKIDNVHKDETYVINKNVTTIMIESADSYY